MVGEGHLVTITVDEKFVSQLFKAEVFRYGASEISATSRAEGWHAPGTVARCVSLEW